MKKRQIIILGSLLTIITLIVIALSGGGKPAEKLEQQKKEVTYVRTEKVLNTNESYVIRSNGRVGSSRNVMLVAEVQGKLMPGQIALKPGTAFKQGQLICRINDTEMGLKLQARKSNYLTLIATAIPDIKIDYPASFRKWEAFFEGIEVTKDLPELPEISSVKEKTYVASRNILGEYYSIKADEEMLDKFNIVAPFDGSLVDVISEFGSVVNPGSQIARIIQTGNLEVEMPVSVEEAILLDIGDVVQANSTDKAVVYQGKIVRIGRYVNPNTQSVDIFIGLNSKAAEKIYDGMYVELEIQADTLKEVVKVPRKALVGKSEVFIVASDSLLVRKTVEIRAKDEQFAYLGGLNDGEDVVIEALSNPVDSMIVRKISSNE